VSGSRRGNGSSPASDGSGVGSRRADRDGASRDPDRDGQRLRDRLERRALAVLGVLTVALLLVAVAARPDALSAATAWLPAVASPNAGWPMGTLAAALDVRLEKPGAYVLNPTAPLPTVADTRRATRLVAVAGVLAYLLAAALTALPGVVV